MSISEFTTNSIYKTIKITSPQDTIVIPETEFTPEQDIAALLVNGSGVFKKGIKVGYSTTKVPGTIYFDPTQNIFFGVIDGRVLEIGEALSVEETDTIELVLEGEYGNILQANLKTLLPGNFTFLNNLDVGEQLTADNLLINKNITGLENLYLGGTALIDGNLTTLGTISTNTIFADFMNITSALYITNSTIIGNVKKIGNETITGTLYVGQDASVLGKAYFQTVISNNALINSNLTVLKNIYANGSQTILGNLDIGGSITFNGGEVFSSLKVTNMTVTSNLTVGDHGTINRVTGKDITNTNLTSINITNTNLNTSNLTVTNSITNYGNMFNFGGFTSLGQIYGTRLQVSNLTTTNSNILGTQNIIGSQTIMSNQTVDGNQTVLNSGYFGGSLSVLHTAFINTIVTAGITNTGNLYNAGTLTSVGQITTTNISTAGLTATNNILNMGNEVIAGYLIVGGNISTLAAAYLPTITNTNITTSYLTATNALISNLTTTGGQQHAGNVTFLSNVLIAGNLSTIGAATFTNVTVNTNLTVGGNQTVLGNLLANSNLTVTQSAYIAGQLTTVGGLLVNGPLTATNIQTSNLTVTNNQQISGSLLVQGNASIGGNLSTVGTLWAPTANITNLQVSNLTVTNNLLESGNMTVLGNLQVSGNLVITNLQVSNMTVLGAQTNIQPAYYASDITVLGTAYLSNILTSNLTTVGNITHNGNEVLGGNLTVVGAGVFNNLQALTISALNTLYVGSSALINNLSILGNRIDYGINVLDMGESGTGDFILGNTNGVAVQSINQTALRLTGDNTNVNIKIDEIINTIEIKSDTLLIYGTSGANNSVLLTGNMSISNNLSVPNVLGSVLNVNTILASTNNSVLLSGNLSITNNLYATNLLGSVLNVNTILAAANNNNSVLLSGSLSVTSNLYASNLTVSTLNVNTILAPNNTVIVSGNISATGTILSGGINVREQKTILYQNRSPGETFESTQPLPKIISTLTTLYVSSGGNVEITAFLSGYFDTASSTDVLYSYYLYVDSNSVAQRDFYCNPNMIDTHINLQPLYCILPNLSPGSHIIGIGILDGGNIFSGFNGHMFMDTNDRASIYVTEY